MSSSVIWNYIGLLDVDASAGRSLGFRDHDAKDAVLQARLDVLMVDARREGKRARELANRSFREPVS